jgi:hypothetical protein
MRKKESNDQDVNSEDEAQNIDDNVISFGKQTFLHSRNTSHPPSTTANRNYSKDFKAEYQKLSEQLINEAASQG